MFLLRPGEGVHREGHDEVPQVQVAYSHALCFAISYVMLCVCYDITCYVMVCCVVLCYMMLFSIRLYAILYYVL